MISIRVVSRGGEPPSPPMEASFGNDGGDIGRGSDCTLALPDPERRISRKHVQVAHRLGRHSIRLISTNLPVELDGVPLLPGSEYPLGPGAQIRIGPYLLQVAEPAHDVLDVLAPMRRPGQRPSVFHDLLHAHDAPPEAGRVAAVDLLVGDTSGVHPGARPPDPVAALYAGLGLERGAPRDASPEQLRLVGALLRAAIGGTLELLAARSISKRELGGSLTLPRAGENNPLKFSPDVGTALTHLLDPPERGFVPPLVAVREAYDDLKAHEMSVMAGMRAALEAVLARFDPEALEARLSPGRWDNLLPANHKARLWERYAELHAELMREIEDDFDDLFGRAFRDAYEAQLASLSATRGHPASR
jgi:predicted component of type VI protein secretion system